MKVEVRGSNHAVTPISVRDFGILFTNTHFYADAEYFHKFALRRRESSMGGPRDIERHCLGSRIHILQRVSQVWDDCCICNGTFAQAEAVYSDSRGEGKSVG